MSAAALVASGPAALAAAGPAASSGGPLVVHAGGSAAVSSSEAAAAVAASVPAVKVKRSRNLSDAERARRTAHIVQYATVGGKASASGRTPEQQKEFAAMGGRARVAIFRAAVEALKPESPEEVKARRKALEGKRDKLLNALLAAADGGKPLKADLSTVKAALGEVRAEIGLLLDRESRARAAAAADAAANPGGRVPVAAAAAVPVVPVVPEAAAGPDPAAVAAVPLLDD